MKLVVPLLVLQFGVTDSMEPVERPDSRRTRVCIALVCSEVPDTCRRLRRHSPHL